MLPFIKTIFIGKKYSTPYLQIKYEKANRYRSAPIDRAKTLFPADWTPTKIADSVNSIIGNTPINELPQPLVRKVDEVWIDIRVKEGRISSVFPAWPQRAPIDE